LTRVFWVNADIFFGFLHQMCLKFHSPIHIEICIVEFLKK